jgi:hypothetical protein
LPVTPKEVRVFYARLQILDFRKREPGVVAVRALPDVNQPAIVTIDHSTKQDAAKQAEHRGVARPYTLSPQSRLGLYLYTGIQIYGSI